MLPEDLTFRLLPVACVLWPPARQGGAVSNAAFDAAFCLASLPDGSALPLGVHVLRLTTRSAEQRVCRLTLLALPDGGQLGVVEDVHPFYLDALTGLYDRRALLLDTAQPVRSGSLALLDIDRFKRVNDTYGHAAGDWALCVLAALLAQAAQTFGARAYRLGGDEFVLLCPQRLAARHLAPVQERFRHVLADLDSLWAPPGVSGAGLGKAGRRQHEFRNPRRPARPLCGGEAELGGQQPGATLYSFSFGLAHAPGDGSALDDLLRRADQRLMACKGQRRSGQELPLGGLYPHPQAPQHAAPRRGADCAGPP